MRKELAEANRARLRRAAGVAVPLFSLRGDHDLGTGEIFDLVPFIDWLARHEQSVLQLLPLNETAPGETSPYAGLTAFALDPAYVSVADVDDVRRSKPAQDWFGSEEAREVRHAARHAATRNKAQAHTVKLRLLEWGFAEFERHAGSERMERFVTFQQRNASWLSQYSLFRVLKEREDWAAWEDWPAHRRHSATASKADDTTRRRQRFFEYVQWIAAEQWEDVRAHARRRGVRLKGDLPFVCARDSADVWAHTELFDLSSSAGTPPDDFSDTGQAWGLPLYAWDAHRRTGFQWWRQRSRQAAGLYDLFRVDHVVGLFRTYAIPVRGGGTEGFVPAEQEQQHELGYALMTALLEEATPEAALIAEDLGTVPDWVRAALTELGIPGYRVFRWEQRHGVFFDPREYPPLSVATTGTHDTDTAVTWWQGLPAEQRSAVEHALGLTVGEDEGQNPALAWPRVHAALLRSLYDSGSMLAILPIQDLFGWSDRVNVPATVGQQNWTYRLPFTVEEIDARDDVREQMERVRGQIESSGRSRSKG